MVSVRKKSIANFNLHGVKKSGLSFTKVPYHDFATNSIFRTSCKTDEEKLVAFYCHDFKPWYVNV